MYETRLNKVLNYMKQYVENRFEHNSEPMLNYKDLELVLNYLDKQKEVLDKIKDIFKDYGVKEDIVTYSMYQITGEEVYTILELLEEIE